MSESKCMKKSTVQQLQHLVDYMEENPHFARGAPVFGSSKLSVEQQWRDLADQLNSLGPPMRSIIEWKKTWADLKSRTKKKIAENCHSIRITGGGSYSVNNLSHFEQQIDRTLCLSVSAAPKGKTFGCVEDTNCIDECFNIIDTPPRGNKNVAVVTPNRQEVSPQSNYHHQSSSLKPSDEKQRSYLNQTFSQNKPLHSNNQRTATTTSHHQTSINNNKINIHPNTTDRQSTYFKQNNSQTHQPPQKQPPVSVNIQHTTNQRNSNTSDYIHSNIGLQQKRHQYDEDDEQPSCSSAKKRKTAADDQLALIRRQLKLGQEAASIAKEQADATKLLANAAQRMADAAEKQAAAAAEITAVLKVLVENVQTLLQNK